MVPVSRGASGAEVTVVLVPLGGLGVVEGMGTGSRRGTVVLVSPPGDGFDVVVTTGTDVGVTEAQSWAEDDAPEGGGSLGLPCPRSSKCHPSANEPEAVRSLGPSWA